MTQTHDREALRLLDDLCAALQSQNGKHNGKWGWETFPAKIAEIRKKIADAKTTPQPAIPVGAVEALEALDRIIDAAVDQSAIADFTDDAAIVRAAISLTGELVSDMWALKWIAAPRPPVHPKEMEGNQKFLTFDKAVTSMSKQSADAKFVSLTRLSTRTEDYSEMARALLSRVREG